MTNEHHPVRTDLAVEAKDMYTEKKKDKNRKFQELRLKNLIIMVSKLTGLISLKKVKIPYRRKLERILLYLPMELKNKILPNKETLLRLLQKNWNL